MKNKKIMSEMNVVPYIDIMFVLLIIFIIASPFVSTEIDVELPTQADKERVEKPLNKVLFISEDGQLMLNNEIITMGDVRNRLDINDRIYIGADKNIPYGDLVEVMNILNEDGFADIQLILN